MVNKMNQSIEKKDSENMTPIPVTEVSNITPANNIENCLSPHKKHGNKQFFQDTKTKVSQVKHGILRSYLGGWIPILYQNPWRIRARFSASCPQYKRMVYVDGFAGPGEYLHGEEGSPTIAYDVAINLDCLKKDGPEICLIFIEKNKEKSNQLLQNLMALKRNKCEERSINIVKYMVINGEFVEGMDWILSTGFEFPVNSFETIFEVPKNLQSHQTTETFIEIYTPILVFADPFGYNGKHMPMATMIKILESSLKSEILVNLMSGDMSRFWELETKEKAINLLLGNENDASWKQTVLAESTADQRVKKFLQLYDEKLSEECGDSLTCLFKLKDERNKLKYNLYFACPHDKGFKKMKYAMGKESQKIESFQYSAFKDNKSDFEKDKVSYDQLEGPIIDKFKDKVVYGTDIIAFIKNDAHLTDRYKRRLKISLLKYQVSDQVNIRIKFDDIRYSFRNIVKSAKKNIKKQTEQTDSSFFQPKKSKFM